MSRTERQELGLSGEPDAAESSPPLQRPLGLGGGRRERALYGRVRGRYKWIHITINVASPTLTVLTGKAPV